VGPRGKPPKTERRPRLFANVLSPPGLGRSVCGGGAPTRKEDGLVTISNWHFLTHMPVLRHFIFLQMGTMAQHIVCRI